MKTHNCKIIIHSHTCVWLACLFLLLPAANGRAQCLLQRYWPMNNGDNTYFTNSSLGVFGSQSISSTYGGFILEQTSPDGSGGTVTGDAYLSYSTDRVLVSELSAIGYDIYFDNDLIFLNEGILKNGGSVTSSSTGSILGYDEFNITLTVSASKAGTITVPAGRYTNCVSLSWTLKISANGQSTQIPFNAFVLAPGVGAIRQAIYNYSGTTVTQEGWADLTSGQVGGVSVADLAALSGLTVPEFTLQPRSTVATNNGIAVFRAAATGGAVQYQWQKDGFDLSNEGNISGAASSNLVINPAHYSDQGLYSVTIVNPVCSVSSTGAVLSVIADTTRPTVSILSPAPNSNVSNATIQVTGKATDNIAVDHVNVWVDSSTPITATGTTNWVAGFTLTAGSHTIFAQSFDLDNNASPIASNKVTYVVSAVLTVHTNGNGTVNPNYNGAMLQIGKGYSMTATAGSGFAFANWTGGTNLPLTLVTNGTTVQFLMVTNLMLQANFVDATRPTLSITNVTAGMSVSNAPFTVKGTAGDNVAVSNVVYSLNHTGWSNAVTGNNWTNWASPVTLLAGTNTIAAYAVDTSGNVSTTNTLNFVYVVSATLTVSTNGLGSLNPNYSGALLQIGKNYLITATAGTGFTFTNWSGGTNLPLTIITNGTTVQFLMVSNLMLQANFVDTTKPTLSVTNLTSGQRVSNAVFTVTGTASDNWMITNVWCQIVGNDWTNATSANHWTNWLAANLPLTPGTNVLLAYAVDTTGNRSTTNSVSFQYVVSAPLQVQLAGLGTINPNYSNAVLAIGQSYTLTASPGSGFTFTNWSGGTGLPLEWLTNGTTVRFVMESNLILQANFVDTTKPTLSVTNLTSGQRVSNATFTVKGTASDNWMITNVWCQVVGNDWTNATSANRWTNWSAADLPLTPGTNVLLAYAVDTTGNRSTTNTVSFQYVVTNQLGVRAVGLGTISPNYSNAWLEIGRNYSMTATPGSGFLFTNWTISTNWIGGMMTNKATVQFMMESNLTLQVSFADVTKPALTITAPTSGQHLTNALANVKGTASDNWKVTNVWYQLNTNAWSLATSTNGWTNWTVTLPLVAGTNSIKAYAVDLGANGSTTNSVSFVSSNTFTLQLGITAGELMTSNGLGFNLQVSPGLNGRIEASTNLVNWTTLTNFVGTNTTIYFRDPAAGNLNLRFYRAVTP